MKIFIKFKKVSVTKAGDYYQIVFHDDLDTEDEPYFMIQSQSEFPDGGRKKRVSAAISQERK